jgi:hypothetical protein
MKAKQNKSKFDDEINQRKGSVYIVKGTPLRSLK